MVQLTETAVSKVKEILGIPGSQASRAPHRSGGRRMLRIQLFHGFRKHPQHAGQDLQVRRSCRCSSIRPACCIWTAPKWTTSRPWKGRDLSSTIPMSRAPAGAAAPSAPNTQRNRTNRASRGYASGALFIYEPPGGSSPSSPTPPPSRLTPCQPPRRWPSSIGKIKRWLERWPPRFRESRKRWTASWNWCARAAGCSISAPEPAAGWAFWMPPNVRRRFKCRRSWCRASWPAAKRRWPGPPRLLKTIREAGQRDLAARGFTSERRSGGNRRQRPHSLRAGRGGGGQRAGRADHRDQLHAGFAAGASRADCDYAAGGSGGDCRIHANEGGHGHQAGVEHDQHWR